MILYVGVNSRRLKRERLWKGGSGGSILRMVDSRVGGDAAVVREEERGGWMDGWLYFFSSIAV